MDMAFSVPEVRDELQMLGHDYVPDHVIIDFLSQSQRYDTRSADTPSLYTSKAASDDNSYPPPSVRGGKSSREVHGRPVPGDRDFRRSTQRSDNTGQGLDSLCFTPDFAAEVEEMRKMLRIMEGTKEQIFGSRNSRYRLKQAIGVLGLAHEHEQYVGKLFSEWRVVGKVLRCKSKDKNEEAGNPSVSEGSSNLEPETSNCAEILEEDGLSNSKENKPVGLDRFDGKADSTGVYNDVVSEDFEDVDEKVEQLVRQRGSAKAKGKVSAESDGEAPTNFADFEGEENSREASRAMAAGSDDYDRGGPITIDKYESDAGPRRRISADGTGEFLWADSASEAESSNAHEVGDICDKEIYDTSSLKQEDGFDSSLGIDASSLASKGSDPQRIPNDDPETLAKVYRTNSGSSKFNLPISLVIPNDRENPLDSSSQLRTPDRRHSDHHSPFNDIPSNIPTGNDQRRAQRRPAEEGRLRQKPWVTGLNTPEKSPKRVLSFGRKDRADARASQTPSNVPEDLLDRILAKSPPSSLRVKSGKGFRPPTTEKMDSRIPTPRVKAVNDAPNAQGESASKDASDPSNHLEITPLHPLTPIKVDKACGVSEPRHGSCTVCAARHAARSGDISPYALQKSGSRSPAFGGAMSPGPLTKSTSARQTFNAQDASPKQSTMKKGSGIFTPLSRDTKKANILLKTSGSRLSSSVDLTDSERTVYRRQGSLRSSAESSRSSDAQGSSKDSKSGLESPSLTRSSTTWNERSRIPKEKLTPGGPRRGGKVDRVARGSDDTRPNEQPPFVVPLHSNSERIRLMMYHTKRLSEYFNQQDTTPSRERTTDRAISAVRATAVGPAKLLSSDCTEETSPGDSGFSVYSCTTRQTHNSWRLQLSVHMKGAQAQDIEGESAPLFSRQACYLLGVYGRVHRSYVFVNLLTA